MSDINPGIESNLFILSLNDSVITVEEAWKPSATLPLRFGPVGVWDDAHGITLIGRNKWERRSDLTGVLIEATTLPVGILADPYLS